MKKLLITGFEPFGGEEINPSWEAVLRLPDQINEYTLSKLRLPVEFGGAAECTMSQWASGFIENAVVNTGIQLDNVETMVHGLCEYVATSVMNVIAFGVIVIGVTILQVILKIFAELLRKNELFRTIDGVLGAIFFLGIYATVVSVVFDIVFVVASFLFVILASKEYV